MYKYASGIGHSVCLNPKATSLFLNLLFSWVPYSGEGIATLDWNSLPVISTPSSLTLVIQIVIQSWLTYLHGTSRCHQAVQAAARVS